MLNRTVAGMLTENTGRALLDSGNHYGRNWERNQGRNFEATPPYHLEASCYLDSKPGKLKLDLSATIDLYHWMDQNLKFCPKVDRKLQRALKAKKNEDKYEMEIMTDFATEHGTGEWPWETVEVTNTYNYDCDLSQTIRYVGYTDPEFGSMMLIQVHGGCDVRGGYTSPKAFQCLNEYPDTQVRGLFAGPYSWSCEGIYYIYNEENGNNLNLKTMPVIDQNHADELDITGITEPCIIVHDSKAYVIVLEQDFDTNMSDLFSGEPAYTMVWVAHELQIAY